MKEHSFSFLILLLLLLLLWPPFHFGRQKWPSPSPGKGWPASSPAWRREAINEKFTECGHSDYATYHIVYLCVRPLSLSLFLLLCLLLHNIIRPLLPLICQLNLCLRCFLWIHRTPHCESCKYKSKSNRTHEFKCERWRERERERER